MYGADPEGPAKGPLNQTRFPTDPPHRPQSRRLCALPLEPAPQEKEQLRAGEALTPPFTVMTRGWDT